MFVPSSKIVHYSFVLSESLECENYFVYSI